ncbi:SRPBCC family protein [Mesorhizobium sp. VK23B]|uniref:SRPBCC family protein n=1 Tax=Mesorhizobium dulcispinae TaxID=3072316 RepID=A0ABU4X7I2_9HYPH|nr:MULTISPECIES: SRPBCC family protein [unclassified Mesorhizobium]MDX8464153.1 SRPBCC family protein [Mesorhizobium sp. VK23B]MDX8470539.1 SRPBCC family protein [Mesorhizobium sp. VK23A]MDX8517932.1 SRPBCC family protein [Mesorhizobium sp. VK23D]
MGSVIREMIVDASPESVWRTVGNFAEGPRLTTPDIFVDCRLVEPDLRQMTFAGGKVVHERLIARDEQARRIVWAWEGEEVRHDNTSMQVFAENNGRSRLVWIHDTAPDELCGWLAAAMDQLAPEIRRSLEAAS